MSAFDVFALAFGLLIIGLLTAGALALVGLGQDRAVCESHGGTYVEINDNYKCITDWKVVKVNGNH